MFGKSLELLAALSLVCGFTAPVIAQSLDQHRFSYLEDKLKTSSAPSGLLGRTNTGSPYKTTRSPNGFYVEKAATAVRKLPWKAVHFKTSNKDLLGRRTISTTVQMMNAYNGNDMMGLIYGYRNEKDYYFYGLNALGQLKLFKIYDERKPFDSRISGSMAVLAVDTTVNKSVFSYSIATSPKLADYPSSPFGGYGNIPNRRFVLPRSYRLSIIEHRNKIDLYVDNELFFTQKLKPKAGAFVGLGVFGSGKFRFVNYAVKIR